MTRPDQLPSLRVMRPDLICARYSHIDPPQASWKSVNCVASCSVMSSGFGASHLNGVCYDRFDAVLANQVLWSVFLAES
jgi:hypothetical protein